MFGTSLDTSECALTAARPRAVRAMLQSRSLTGQQHAEPSGVCAHAFEHLIHARSLWRRRVGRSVRFLLGDVLCQLATTFRVQAHDPASSATRHTLGS